jgi:hypothetical protein
MIILLKNLALISAELADKAAIRYRYRCASIAVRLNGDTICKSQGWRSIEDLKKCPLTAIRGSELGILRASNDDAEAIVHG